MKIYNFIKKEIPAQMFSFEFCKNFKNSFLQNTSDRLFLQISFCLTSNKGSSKTTPRKTFEH